MLGFGESDRLEQRLSLPTRLERLFDRDGNVWSPARVDVSSGYFQRLRLDRNRHPLLHMQHHTLFNQVMFMVHRPYGAKAHLWRADCANLGASEAQRILS